ncbi:MAG: hypothetical protein ACOC5T_06525 [Elusimicrobiota bacterium]
MINTGEYLQGCKGYKCERCGHEWVPRNKEEYPKVWPKSKSPYWETPRKKD